MFPPETEGSLFKSAACHCMSSGILGILILLLPPSPTSSVLSLFHPSPISLLPRSFRILHDHFHERMLRLVCSRVRLSLSLVLLLCCAATAGNLLETIAFSASAASAENSRDPAPMQLVLFPNATQRNAVCNDGTPSGYCTSLLAFAADTCAWRRCC